MKDMTFIAFLVLQLSPALVVQTWAEEVTDLGGKKLSVPTLVRAFSQEQVLNTRSICRESATEPGPGHCPKTTVPKPVSLDQITFAFDSAELTAQARQVLDMIGTALKSEQLKGRSFEVEGHTDGKGSEAYNFALSKRRAEAVKRYLATVARIDGERLDVVPMGEEDLLYPDDSANPKNRRVVFRGLTEQVRE